MSPLRKAFILGILVFLLGAIVANIVSPKTWGNIDRTALGPDGEQVFGLMLALHPSGVAHYHEAEAMCHMGGGHPG